MKIVERTFLRSGATLRGKSTSKILWVHAYRKMTAQMVLHAWCLPSNETRVRHRTALRLWERESADLCVYSAYFRRFDRSIIPAVFPATARETTGWEALRLTGGSRVLDRFFSPVFLENEKGAKKKKKNEKNWGEFRSTHFWREESTFRHSVANYTARRPRITLVFATRDASIARLVDKLIHLAEMVRLA